MSAVDLQLSLADVARVARVQRPVATMWVSRFAGSATPFPSAVRAEGQRRYYDADEVAAWLLATGLGNNPSAADDIAAFAAGGEVQPRDRREDFDAITAMLCLRAISGVDPAELDEDAILDLADEHDPDDRLLYSELSVVRGRVEAVARHAHRLADAAVSLPAAFESALAQAHRSPVPELSTVAVRPVIHDLLAQLAVALANRDGSRPIYVDPTGDSDNALLAVLQQQADRGEYDLLTASPATPTARLARRRLRTHGIFRSELPIVDGGTFEAPDTATHVATLLKPAVTDVEKLTAVDNIVVQMGEFQSGVVLAPARILCDALADASALAIRDDMLRSGRVRAIVRLPAGHVVARSREALGLWVLGPSHAEDPPADRLTLVADLSGMKLTEAVVDQLVTDATASAGGRALVRSHTFTHLRPVAIRMLTARRGSLLPRTAHRARSDGDGLNSAMRLEALRPSLNAALPAVGPGGTVPTPISLGAALDAAHARLLPGNRIVADDLRGDGTVRVIGRPELSGTTPVGARTIDRLRLSHRYPAARLSEPGDVVFSTTPRPTALVDHDGGALVEYPARVLRIDPGDPGGLVPDVVAADINALPGTAKSPRTWALRAIPDDQRDPLNDGLASIRTARDEAARRMRDLDEAAALLTDVATSGSVSLLPATKGT